jgi:hypothetical protein
MMHYLLSPAYEFAFRFIGLGILGWDIIQCIWSFDFPITWNLIGERVFHENKIVTVRLKS